MTLEHPASSQRVSSGVPELDGMLGGKGFFRGIDSPDFRHRRRGQEQPRRSVCRCGLPARRTLPVLCL